MTARRSIEAQGPARVENRRFKARGRNYTWATAFTVPIEVRVA
jgi:hypothetical protein